MPAEESNCHNQCCSSRPRQNMTTSYDHSRVLPVTMESSNLAVGFRGWFERFMKRQPELSLRKGDATTNVCINSGTPEAMSQYFELGWAQPPPYFPNAYNYNNTTLKRTLSTSKNKDEQRKATTIVTYNQE